jgi:hypothetical protein
MSAPPLSLSTLSNDSVDDLCSSTELVSHSFMFADELANRSVGMFVCEFICAIIGVTDGSNPSAVKGQISLICIYIFFFASTWGPGAWVVIGEIFPIPIRSRGVGLSTASNWLWNCILTVITPYLVGTDQAVSHFHSFTSSDADL